MEILKRSLLMILVLLLVGGSVYGGFYLFRKRYSSKSPMQTDVIGTTTQIIPGFERDLNNKLPGLFPIKLISEEGIVSVESFSIDSKIQKQYTYRYITNWTGAHNYTYFINYLSRNGWSIKYAQKTLSEEPTSPWFIEAYSSEKSLNLSFSPKIVGDKGIVDITYIILKI